MKCPKCGYTSFDYLDECKKCGSDLRDVRTLLQIIAISPEDRSAPPSASRAPLSEREPSGAPLQAADSSPAQGAEGADQDLFQNLDFDDSFDDMVQHTSYQNPPPEEPPAQKADELLDLDFGELFGEKKPSQD